jgi:integrase
MSGRVRDRAIIIQRKTGRPVQFEITETTRRSVQNWIDARKQYSGYLFPSRHRESPHLSRRQYARIVDDWVKQIGLDPSAYGTCAGSSTRSMSAAMHRSRPRRSRASSCFTTSKPRSAASLRPCGAPSRIDELMPWAYTEKSP